MSKRKISDSNISLWNIQIEYSDHASMLIAIFGSGMFVFWGYMFSQVVPNNFDPLWLRTVVILPFFGLLLTPKRFRPLSFSTQGILLCASILVTSHSLGLWLMNFQSIHYAIGCVLTFSVTLLFATSVKYFLVMSSIAFLSCAIPFVHGLQATHSLFYFSAIMTTVGSAFFALSARLRSQQILMKQKFQLERQFDSLMHAHKRLVTEKVRNASSARLAAIGEMAAGVAHEVNNPLTIVRGYLMRLKSMNATEALPAGALNEHILHIYKSLDRIAHVVRSLVNISAVDSTKAKDRVSVKQMVDVSTSFFKERLKQHSIELFVELPEQDHFAHGYANQLSQCLVNLISNAFDAAKECASANPEMPGLGWIRVKMTSDSDFVCISVIDSGLGIDPTRISKVFDPFYTTKLNKKASGLGLSVSRSMIENLGGSLDYDETSNNTKFDLRIPIFKENKITTEEEFNSKKSA